MIRLAMRLTRVRRERAARAGIFALLIALRPATAQGQAKAAEPGAPAPQEPPATMLTRDAEVLEADLALARLFEAKKDYPRALAAWRKLLAAAPDNQVYMLRTAVVADDLKRYAIALPLAKKLVLLDGKSMRYRLLLVDALLGLKQLSAARPHLKWLLPYKPNDVNLRESLAAAFSKAKQPAQALPHYHWLVHRAPKKAAYRLARAYAYGDLRQHRKRLAEIEHLLRGHPKDLRYRLERVSCYGDLGWTKKELAELRSLMALAPQDMKVARRVAQILFDGERFDETKRHLKRVLARAKPPQKKPSWALALLARLEKREADARRKAASERVEAERWAEALSDLQDRAEDF